MPGLDSRQFWEILPYRSFKKKPDRPFWLLFWSGVLEIFKISKPAIFPNYYTWSQARFGWIRSGEGNLYIIIQADNIIVFWDPDHIRNWHPSSIVLPLTAIVYFWSTDLALPIDFLRTKDMIFMRGILISPPWLSCIGAIMGIFIGVVFTWDVGLNYSRSFFSQIIILIKTSRKIYNIMSGLSFPWQTYSPESLALGSPI